jgi:transcription elongation factor GreA
MVPLSVWGRPIIALVLLPRDKWSADLTPPAKSPYNQIQERATVSASEEDPTLREAASIYLTGLPPQERQDAQADVRKFVRWYGADRSMGDMTGHDVSGYAEGLGVTLTDAAAKLEPVRAFLAFAKKKGFTTVNMAVHLRPPKATKASKIQRRAGEEETVSITREGIVTLEAELEELRARRPHIAAELRRAMADKDFRENAPLDAAREQQGHLEARIRELEATLRHAVVMEEAKKSASVVGLGSTVLLRNLRTGAELKYVLVHPREVTPGQGKISIASPVGRALVRKKEGEEVEVEAPSGSIRFRIEKVQT